MALQIFDRSHLKVNKDTQDAIIKRYNSHTDTCNHLCEFLTWVDNNTYLLDGDRYLISNDTEPVTTTELIRLFKLKI